MPDQPLLVLPNAEAGKRPRPGFAVSNLVKPSRRRQGQRFTPQFSRLGNMLNRPNAGLELRSDPASIAPERAIVFEVAGSIDKFYRAVQRIEGFEFLVDEEALFDPDVDFAIKETRKDREAETRDDKPVDGRLYIAMPDIRALQELISLWSRWQNDEDFGHGLAKWKMLFANLKKIRPWGPEDRLTVETVNYLQEKMETAPDFPIRTEIELWFHEGRTRREQAFQNFENIVQESGGIIIDHAVIEDIRYEGVLVDIPANEIAALVAGEQVNLAICDEIMFIRPQSACSFPVDGDEVESGPEPDAEVLNDREPIAALFDGMPVQGHRLLNDRIIVDDPEGLEDLSVVNERVHGTQMASLIIHGDRNIGESALSRRLYVRPVMFAPGGGANEQPLDNRLLLDVIYTAVKRMKEGDEEGEATAPSVFLVNLSLGDLNRPFSGPMSPWGRLLDFLSAKYGILFLVSAGNIDNALILPRYSNWTEFEDADPEEREREVLMAIHERKSERTLLSPAEALNVVTVGGWHEDSVNFDFTGGMHLSPYVGSDLPNVSSALGLGHRKTVKPEIYLPGGKEPVSFRAQGDDILEIISRRETGQQFGLKAATADNAGGLERETLTAGTSAATALATRAAHRIFEALMDEEGGSNHVDMDPEFYAVVTKALLIHSANWGEKGEVLEDLFGPHGQGKYVARRDNVARFLGYGKPIIEHAMQCAPNRATMVGYGEITTEGAHLYRIPLPRSLEMVTELRSVNLTLAWFSPVNARHQAYRCAKLESGPITKMIEVFGVTRSRDQPSDKSTPRGSIFHTIFRGSRAVHFIDDGHLLLRVWCTEQAGQIDEPIRYGMAVTIEAGEGIPVYEEIRAQLAVPVAVQLPA